MKQLFINLPVRDVTISQQFYTALGFTVNSLFTFDDQKCMMWGNQVFLMLQNHAKFHSGNKKELADSTTSAIATFTLPLDSLEAVNRMMEAGLAAGGKEPAPMIDEGFMQVRTLEDPDGHLWGLLFIDLEKFRVATGK